MASTRDDQPVLSTNTEYESQDENFPDTGGKARSHDPDFKGPIKDRSCTDIPCCLIFVLYLIGMLIVGIIAFKEGDLDRLIYPRDSKGNTCGKDFVDKKYLYFFDITKCVKRTSLSDLTSPSCPTPQVCVEKCPDETALSAIIDLDKAICMNNIKPKTRSEFNKLVEQNKCAKYYIASTPVLYRCLPTALGLENITDLNLKKDAVDDGTDALGALMNAKNVGMKIFEDLAMVWYWILGAFVLAMLLSLLWIIITRWIAWPMVWFSILASLILMVIGIYFCYDKYKELEDRGVDKSIEWKFTSNLDGFTDCKKFWLASGIILTIVLVVLLLIILVLRKRINIAIALIKESSRAVGSMISTLFFPIIPWILQLIVFVWFVAVALFLVTNGTAKYHTIGVNGTDNSTECDPNTFNDSKLDCLLAGYETNKHLNRMAVYHFFGWLWLMNFVIALGECVLAGAFASWYFAFHKPDDVPALPVISALGRTLRYHVGSLAFGAAIIAIVQFIRAVLEYIDRKLKESNQDNGFVKFVMKCMKCCFWCLEKCLRFLNKNAYIGIAIYGKSFCRAAKDAFFLLLRNALRVAAINGVTAFLLFIGKLLVVGIIGVGSFFWFDKFVSDFDNIQLSYSVVPIVVCVIGAWVVAAIFFDVYDMAIDTIFFCFLEDSERNDGSAEKPYYMSDNLKDILGK